MTDRTKTWLEKYGLISAITGTIVCVVVSIGSILQMQAAYSELKILTQGNCEKIRGLESFKDAAPKEFVPRAEHNALLDSISVLGRVRDRQHDETMQALRDLRNDFKLHLEERGKK